MQIRAKKLSKKIKVRDVTKTAEFNCISSSGYEAVFEISANSHIVLYSFGVCVFINITSEIENKFLDQQKNVNTVTDNNDTDDFYEIRIEPNLEILIEHNYVRLPEYKLEYIRMISLVLAESVALDFFEIITADILSRSSAYSLILQNKGDYPRRTRELFKFIGFAITTRQEILSNLYISDTPDETWNNPIIEKLYLEIKDMFDIEQRFRSINTSLNAMQESLEIIVNLLQAKRSHYLEWLIIILISIEVVIYIGNLF